MAGGPGAGPVRVSTLGEPPRTRPRTSVLRQCVLLGALLSLLGSVIATGLTVLGVADHDVTGHVTRLLSLGAGAMFLCAGLLRLARWRIVADPRSLLIGTALVVLGGISIPLSSLADVLIQEDSASHLRAATAIVTTLVAMVLVLRALSVSADDELRALPVIAGSCLMAVGLFALVLSTHVLAPQLLHSSMVDPPLVRGAVLAIAWLVLAYLASIGGTHRPWAANLAPLLACMCVGELLRITQVFLPGGWALACVVVMVIVSLVAAHRALLDLDEAARMDLAELEALNRTLTQTQAGMDAFQAWQEELVHDARNALAGLRAALHALHQYDDGLDATASEQLRSAAMGEVDHLEGMISRRGQQQPVDFDIAEAIRSTIETRRAAGLQVELHEYSCTAHGHPGDLATVVQNILVNSQQHAPGAQVRLCVVPAGEKVHLYVADDGPGFSEEEARRIFERGSRGARSTGSGLGLFVARALMRQQGGDVELRGHLAGAVFVVGMPAAKGSPAVPDSEVPQQRLAVPGSTEVLGAGT